jgi:hypothetical protein
MSKYMDFDKVLMDVTTEKNALTRNVKAQKSKEYNTMEESRQNKDRKFKVRVNSWYVVGLLV